MSILSSYLTSKHVRILSLLILLDLIATLTWYLVFGIEEANPLLADRIMNSPVEFVLVKLGLSLPGLYILNKYIKKTLAQGGLALLLVAYYLVALIHVFIFFALV